MKWIVVVMMLVNGQPRAFTLDGAWSNQRACEKYLLSQEMERDLQDISIAAGSTRLRRPGQCTQEEVM